jgi:hypothetical protein
MNSSGATPVTDRKRTPECACGLTFLSPWDLVAHLLSAYPPGADKPLDREHHADATRLAVKLDTGSFGAWEIV